MDRGTWHRARDGEQKRTVCTPRSNISPVLVTSPVLSPLSPACARLLFAMYTLTTSITVLVHNTQGPNDANGTFPPVLPPHSAVPANSALLKHPNFPIIRLSSGRSYHAHPRSLPLPLANEGLHSYDFIDSHANHALLAAYAVGIGIGDALSFAVVKVIATLWAQIFRDGDGAVRSGSGRWRRVKTRKERRMRKRRMRMGVSKAVEGSGRWCDAFPPPLTLHSQSKREVSRSPVDPVGDVNRKPAVAYRPTCSFGPAGVSPHFGNRFLASLGLAVSLPFGNSLYPSSGVLDILEWVKILQLDKPKLNSAKLSSQEPEQHSAKLCVEPAVRTHYQPHRPAAPALLHAP
ncbi:hypothetical protein FIBSPDRAFT_1019361 [Athelia psychrophila]|uniref:Uncharacterized protein n=1 Tax=Athelia psychrophila TaxID=1759441 RepID=A0A166KGP6_9AGAM|nr:hypothetical protein FIBSPDRAFT_1019361 [Fibularhizoctonia sp. CBS 109695]